MVCSVNKCGLMGGGINKNILWSVLEEKEKKKKKKKRSEGKKYITKRKTMGILLPWRDTHWFSLFEYGNSSKFCFLSRSILEEGMYTQYSKQQVSIEEDQGRHGGMIITIHTAWGEHAQHTIDHHTT